MDEFEVEEMRYLETFATNFLALTIYDFCFTI